MKEQNKNIIVEKLENGMLTAVENIIAKHLGVKLALQAEVNHYKWYGWSICLVEGGDATARMFTSTPLLAQLFKSAKMEITLGLNEEENYVWCRVFMRYDHNFEGGSNCHDVMTFAMNPETFETIEVRL